MTPEERCAYFAQEIKRRRAAAGVTQTRMAELLGMSRTSVTNIEAGRQPVSLATACAIADVLDTTLDVLVGDVITL
jgi:transcriptional regulator with XRE-family HTH domain